MYGVTADSVRNPAELVDSARHLPSMPTTRVYFDVKEPPRYYLPAITQLHPVSYVMGDLLDSSDETHVGVAAFNRRVKAYLRTLGPRVDLWEIGNEVNGNWTGPYRSVEVKLTEAYEDVAAARRASALTLYYDIGCGDGSSGLGPVSFTERYVPPRVRMGLHYVFLSYYEDECNGRRPAARPWTRYFERLHRLYPRARLGFGEVGLKEPASRDTMSAARGEMRWYYRLWIPLRYYIGGYFWWYYAEDCLPWQSRPLWRQLASSFRSERRAIG